MLSITDVHKSYGSHEVLRGVDLEVGPGEILGLIGPNGAGKTTLISIACGLRTSESGRILVGDGVAPPVDVLASPRRAASLIGLAPQDLGVYPMLSVEQNLLVFGELAGLGRRQAKARAREVAEAIGLEAELGAKASTLSGGQARRLHTGMALMHRPSVLFLDEPTVGADVAARQAILAVVRALASEGAAVVYTTHYLSEIVDLRADVAILHEGRVVLTGPVDEVLARHAHPTVAVVTRGSSAAPKGWNEDASLGVRAPEGCTRWIPSPTLVFRERPTALVAAALAGLGPRAELMGIEITPPTLESAFLAVTGSPLALDTPDTTTQEVPDVILA